MLKETEFGLKETKNLLHNDFLNLALISRNIYKYHRNLDQILDSDYKNLYVITGRCPSKKLNIIHLVHYKFLADLQKKFNSKVIVCIGPEEAFLLNKYTLDEAVKFANNDIKHILSTGFDTKNTYFIIPTKNLSTKLFNLTLEVSRRITLNQLLNVLGRKYFKSSGSVLIPLLEMAEILYPSYYFNANSLLVFSLTQEVYLRIAEDLSRQLKIKKPAGLFYRRIKDLKGGIRKKSTDTGAIYLEDSFDIITNKIFNAFTGGRDTKTEQKKYGGKPSVCPIFEYFNFFEEDDKKLQEIEKNCVSGGTLCHECKSMLLELIKKFVEKHKESYNKTSDEVLLEMNML